MIETYLTLYNLYYLISLQKTELNSQSDSCITLNQPDDFIKKYYVIVHKTVLVNPLCPCVTNSSRIAKISIPK